MNAIVKIVFVFFLASTYSSQAAQAAEKTEAKPGPLDKVDGMKRHEKEIRDKRNATPDRGQMMREQDNAQHH